MAEQTDWHERGCSRSCRNEHTKVWGWCDLAEEPAPQLNLHISETFTASDGNTSVKERRATVEEARAELAKFETQPDWADLREMARNAGITFRLVRHEAMGWSRWLITAPDCEIDLKDSTGDWMASFSTKDGYANRISPTPAQMIAMARLAGLVGAS